LCLILFRKHCRQLVYVYTANMRLAPPRLPARFSDTEAAMHKTTRLVCYGLIVALTAIGFDSGSAIAQGINAGISSELSPWLAAPIVTAFSLIAVGLLLMLGEALIPGVGVLGFAGIIAFVTGGLIIAGSDVDGASSSWPFFVGLGIA